ncbi:helix-turn-helix transcriptional regulator [Nesterenkonia lacusekhoensis]|uniref:AraC-like DNA-binding protein n=1 Tax=Nesterenkonia lacusekhoensis TaxID=150832 RepID=A0ABS4T3V5_9MICC|nr:AraC family transcriptional regulator [Nesterenkonia lacusekhoensis]MBP2319137.1 AraC-like DNA-binding protein [Nesterenkonia lacusekhoensis]
MTTVASQNGEPGPTLRQKQSFSALTARSGAFHAPFGPWAYDCMKLVVVRSGAAIITTELGPDLVHAGDCLLLSPDVLFGGEPEGLFTATTIYVDTDYLADQVFWQYSNIVNDRLDALGMAETLYAEPVQILKLGPERAGAMMPWLDELTVLSGSGGFPEHFHRMQALWSSIMDVIAPLVSVSSVRRTPTQRARSRPVLPRDRVLAPSRDEAVKVREMLRENPQEQWTLCKLAETIHLSPKQLSRIFAATYGKTPLAYLTMVRVEEMARLLRQRNLPVGEAGKQVGWNSRSRACQAFRECTGMTPQQYRKTWCVRV